MGDLYYVVGDCNGTWEYVCYGKQRELYVNRKELLATFMFIERCHELYYSVQFIKGGASLEYCVMARFVTTIDDWPKHAKDVSDEWLGYAEEELSS